MAQNAPGMVQSGGTPAIEVDGIDGSKLPHDPAIVLR